MCIAEPFCQIIIITTAWLDFELTSFVAAVHHFSFYVMESFSTSEIYEMLLLESYQNNINSPNSAVQLFNHCTTRTTPSQSKAMRLMMMMMMIPIEYE